MEKKILVQYTYNGKNKNKNNIYQCDKFRHRAFHLRRLAGNVAGKLGKRLFTLPQPPGGDVLSINDNSGNAGDTGFAG